MAKRHKLSAQGHKAPQWQGWGYLRVISAQSSALIGPYPCVTMCPPLSCHTEHISAGRSRIQTEVCVFKVDLFLRETYPKNTYHWSSLLFLHPKCPVLFLKTPNLHLAVRKGEWQSTMNLQILSHPLMQAEKVKKWGIRSEVLPLEEDARLFPYHRGLLLSLSREQPTCSEQSRASAEPTEHRIRAWGSLEDKQTHPEARLPFHHSRMERKRSPRVCHAPQSLRHTGGRVRAPRRGL